MPEWIFKGIELSLKMNLSGDQGAQIKYYRLYHLENIPSPIIPMSSGIIPPDVSGIIADIHG